LIPTSYGTHARLTILKQPASPVDAQALALNALGWILGDEDRAERFLSLTGLTPDTLRASLGQPSLLRAVVDHVCAHEPDLVAAADALGVEPQQLAAARGGLS
jgi:hypothetical protein